MKIRLWDRKEPLPWKLLLDADPSKRAVQKYINRGEVWLLEVDGKVLGVMVLMHTRVDTLEIMNIATDAANRSVGLGQALLKKARQRAGELKMQALHVGTGNNSFRQRQFYQRFGFRICGVDKDFFVGRYRREIGEGGIMLRDMVRMELKV